MNFLRRLKIFTKNIIYIISTTEKVHTHAQEIKRFKQLYENHDKYINSHTSELQAIRESFQAYTKRLEEHNKHINNNTKRLEEHNKYINSHTNELKALRETMKEYPNKFTQIGLAHSELKNRYEQLEKQHLKDQNNLNSLKKELENYREIHSETERAMYHFVQKQLLSQSLIYHNKLESFMEKPTQEQANDFTKEYLDTYYLAFEDKFRGSRESILRRYEEYYNFVQNSPKVSLDIGCGRGEWVELLQDRGIDAQGVDLNSAMLQVGKDAGVQNLNEEDAFTFLENIPPNTYDLITAFHIIEHIPFEKLLVLLSQIKRVAKDGAVILLETPNPTNLQVAATHFYNDPTHLNPLPSRVMEFMLEYLGFTEVKTHHINPYAKEHHLDGDNKESQTLNKYLYGAQDYLLVAKV